MVHMVDSLTQKRLPPLQMPLCWKFLTKECQVLSSLLFLFCFSEIVVGPVALSRVVSMKVYSFHP